MALNQLPFPDVTGARDKDGRVCVGSKPSRSKHCRTNLVFYDPVSKVESTVLATDVDWMPRDSKTIAVLQNALRAVLNSKITNPLDRGDAVGRKIGCRFYLMEVARGMLWPRYKWWLPYYMEWHHAVPLLIRYETLFPGVLVAEHDLRQPSLDLAHDPTENETAPVRMLGDHRKWIREVLALRKIQVGDGPA